MDRLQVPLRRVLQDPIDEVGEIRMRRRIAVSRRKPSSRRARVSTAAGLAAVAALLLILVGVWSHRVSRVDTLPPSPPLRLADGGALLHVAAGPEADPAERFLLSDGSVIELDPGVELRAITNTGHEVTLSISQGGTTFDVVPGGSRRWRIHAGPVSVEVLGTRFRILRTSAEVQVSVERGRVRISGDVLERAHELHAGSAVTVAIRQEPPERTEPSASTELAHGELPQPERQGRPPTEEHIDQVPQRPWLELARRRAYSEAFDLLGPRGLEQETEAARSVEQLLALADVARRSGHPRDAVGPLERVISAHPEDEGAAVAAFTLGVLQLEVLGHPRRAAEAFERCIALAPPRVLMEHAERRLVEARAGAEARRCTQREIRDHLLSHPEGDAEETRARLDEDP